MGLSRVFSILGSSKKEQRIVMVGLDNAGKTTILYQVKMGEVVQTTPTIGFNVETVKRKNLSFSVWDVGGQDQVKHRATSPRRMHTESSCSFLSSLHRSEASGDITS